MRCSIVNYRNELVQVETGSNAAPNAGFTSSANNLVVSFSDASTDSDGTIASRAWTFGDGGTSTATNPSHTYAAAGTYSVTLTVTDNDGATDSHSVNVTVTAGGGGGGGSALTSDVPVPNLSAVTGGELHYYIDVPAGATKLTIRIDGGSGDADLYVRRGQKPTRTAYDQRPYLTGNTETVTINNPQAARYFLMLRGYAAFSGVTLVASITMPGGGGGFEEVIENIAASQGQSKMYSVAVPAGATNLSFEISGGTGDADLYIRRGSQPTTSQYDFRPYLDGNDETVTVAAPQSGTWYIMVRAYATFSGVTLRVSHD
jgi:PKD repeat protein